MVIMIIGAGIAGTAAALALHQAGIDVTVQEAHPDSGADIGAFLTLAGNGMLALEQVDAAQAVDATGFPLTSMRVLADTGAELGVRPLAGYRCLRRAELCAALQAEALRRGITIRHGGRLVSASEDATGVTARFGDGSTARADLLIGADGLDSVVRPLIDASTIRPHYAGQRVFYGYTAGATPPGRTERIEMIKGSAAAFGYAVSPDREVYWFARVTGEELTADEITHTSPDEWRDRLVPLLRRDATPAADIVAATGDRLMVTNAHDLPSVARWRTERMLIIGDAAHAASPATGQGASMALEDAIVLAKALRDAPGTALETYERLRRPRVERNVAASARLSEGRPPDGPRETDTDLPGLLDWNTPLAQT